MDTNNTLVIESDWLPSPELDRLVGQLRQEFPSLGVARPEDGGHRGLDPTVAVALVSGAFTVIAPFVAKLVDKLFSKEPQANVKLIEPDGASEIVLDGQMSAEERLKILETAFASGRQFKIRIGTSG